MNSLQDALSVSFIVVFLVLILSFLAFYHGKTRQEPVILTKEEMLSLANSTADFLKFYYRGAVITDGPRLVNGTDRREMEALFSDVGHPAYFVRLSSGEKELFIVMNNTDVVRVVPVTRFSLG